jgi:hypothetical protein
MDASRTLMDRLEELKNLNQSRFDFVRARASTTDNIRAIEMIGKSKSWYYTFSEEERNRLEALAHELHYARAVQAELMLQDAVEEAAQVKVEGLREEDPRIRQAASTEILDRVIGKSEDRLKVTGKVELIWKPHKPTGKS